MSDLHLIWGFAPVFFRPSRDRHIRSLGPIIYLPHDPDYVGVLHHVKRVKVFYGITLSILLLILLKVL